MDKEAGTIRVLLTIERIPASRSQPGPVIGVLTAKSCSKPEDGGERPFRDLEIVSVAIDPDAGIDGLAGESVNTDEEKAAFAVRLTGTLLDEALLAFQAEGYEIVYASGESDENEYRALLKERGFVRIPGARNRFCTDLRMPLVLFGDASASIQDPFCDDPALLAVQRDNIRRLRLGVAGL